MNNLPNLLDRDFIIAFFLPALVFEVACAFLLSVFFPEDPALSGSLISRLTDPTYLGLAALGAIILLALNRQIIRMVEGYGAFNPARLFTWLQSLRFDLLRFELVELERRRDPALRNRYGELLRRWAYEFPDIEDWLLPTRFGNIIRAHEVYPRVMHGLEGIQGWSRLYFMLKPEDREEIKRSKAQMDLWVNLFVLNLVFLIGYLALVIHQARWVLPALAPAGIALSALLYRAACEAAKQRGEAIRAAFDLFLPKLQEALDLVPTSDKRQMWSDFSQRVIYRRLRAQPTSPPNYNEPNWSLVDRYGQFFGAAILAGTLIAAAFAAAKEKRTSPLPSPPQIAPARSAQPPGGPDER